MAAVPGVRPPRGQYQYQLHLWQHCFVCDVFNPNPILKLCLRVAVTFAIRRHTAFCTPMPPCTMQRLQSPRDIMFMIVTSRHLAAAHATAYRLKVTAGLGR